MNQCHLVCQSVLVNKVREEGDLGETYEGDELRDLRSCRLLEGEGELDLDLERERLREDLDLLLDLLTETPKI